MKGKAIIQMINPFTQKVEEQFENKNIITLSFEQICIRQRSNYACCFISVRYVLKH